MAKKDTTLHSLWNNHRSGMWIIIITTLVLIAFTYSRTRLTTNTRSRIITVERIVEKGTMAHATPTDTTPFQLSIDAIKIGDKIYSSKPAIYPFIMAGESIVIKKAGGGEFYKSQKSYIRILTLLNQVLPYAVMLIMVLIFTTHYYSDKWTVNFMLLAMSIGSLAFGYAVTINNHTVAAILFFFSFYYTWRILYLNKTRISNFILLGLFAGLGFTMELPGLILMLIFLFLVFLKYPKKALTGISMAAVPIMVFLITNYLLTGSIVPIYMQNDLYNYENSYWINEISFDALNESKWLYLFHILIGDHGLFSITPVLILGLIGLIQSIRNKTPEYWKMMTWLAGGMFVIFLFVLTRTHNYGGYSIGLRWFIVFMPLLMIAGLPFVHQLGKSLKGKVIAIGLLVLSLPFVIQALYWDGFIRSFIDVWVRGKGM
jgi:hypothetical protein